MKLIDVTLPLQAGLPSYPGNAPFTLEPVKRLARGDSSNVSTLHLSAHTGTHVDAPRHFFDEGSGTDTLPLDILCGRARVIEVMTRKAIVVQDLEEFDLSEDVRLLIKTSNSRLWASPEFHTDYVGVSGPAAHYLVERGVKLVGVDYLSVEQFRTPGAPAHRALLGAGTVIVEGLDLREIEAGHYEMFCLPLAIVGADGAPARVVLRKS